MKKLTDKDAILCVSIEEAISIRDKFQLNIEDENFKFIRLGIKEYGKICFFKEGYYDRLRYAKENGFKITKASKILNKGISKKELIRRIEKLEKVMIDNTEVTVSDLIVKEIDWSQMSRNNTTKSKPSIHKKDVPDPPPAVPTEEKPLSIREVQVKVNSQEEANECAEIAKAYGEQIGNITVIGKFKTFRLDNFIGNFFVSSIGDSKNTEISIQEFRERFGKPKELEPVLALIKDVNDLGSSSWYEVVFYAKKWDSYAGSKTFKNGEKVLKWEYCNKLLPITLSN